MQLTTYQAALARRAPEINPLHMETLAFSIGSILNGMPPEFFDEIAALARKMGPEELAAWHEAETV